MKLVIDRIAPISAFDVSKGGSNNMPQITINVTGLSQPTVDMVEDVTDVEDNNG